MTFVVEVWVRVVVVACLPTHIGLVREVHIGRHMCKGDISGVCMSRSVFCVAIWHLCVCVCSR